MSFVKLIFIGVLVLLRYVRLTNQGTNLVVITVSRSLFPGHTR